MQKLRTFCRSRGVRPAVTALPSSLAHLRGTVGLSLGSCQSNGTESSVCVCTRANVCTRRPCIWGRGVGDGGGQNLQIPKPRPYSLENAIISG